MSVENLYAPIIITAEMIAASKSGRVTPTVPAIPGICECGCARTSEGVCLRCGDLHPALKAWADEGAGTVRERDARREALTRYRDEALFRVRSEERAK